MVLRQVALNGTERIEFICFIIKFSFVVVLRKRAVLVKKRQPLVNIISYIFPPHWGKHVYYSVTGTSLMRAIVVASPFVILWAPASSTTVVGAPACFTPSTFTLVFAPERP